MSSYNSFKKKNECAVRIGSGGGGARTLNRMTAPGRTKVRQLAKSHTSYQSPAVKNETAARIISPIMCNLVPRTRSYFPIQFYRALFARP